MALATASHQPGAHRVNGAWIVRLPTGLGDTLMALPVLRAVQRSCERTVLWGPPAYRELLAAAGPATDYLPYRRRRGLAGASDLIHAAANLRHLRADAVLLLPNAFEPALLAAVAGIPRRIGYATDGRGPLLTDVVADTRPRHTVHEADRFAHLAEHAGFGPAEPDDHRLDHAELDRYAAKILPPGASYVGIVAGSANDPAKRWPAAAYARLIDLLHRQWGAHPLLLGSDADRPLNDEIGAMCGVETTNLSGGSLVDLAATLLRCRMIVGNDTGGAHLAAALGRPTAVIFGPTDPARSCPRGDRVVVLSARRFCQPCGYGDCPLDHACMEKLDPHRVLAILEPLWNR